MAFPETDHFFVVSQLAGADPERPLGSDLLSDPSVPGAVIRTEVRWLTIAAKKPH